MRAQIGSSLLSVVSVFLLSVILVACGARQRTDEAGARELSRPDRLRYGTLDLSQYEEESVDVNGDGVSDILRYRRGGVVWVERFDLNFDGRFDMTSYYDVSGGVLEQEFQLDYDDVVDVVRLYEAGVLVEKHVSTEFDGTFSLIKYYSASGDLLRIERDSDLDGRVDVWEYYDGATLIRVGRDMDGDGVPEVMTDIQ